MKRFRFCIGAVSNLFLLVSVVLLVFMSIALVSCDDGSSGSSKGSNNGTSGGGGSVAGGTSVSFQLSLDDSITKACSEDASGLEVGANSGKTIAPKPNLMNVSSYSVEGIGPGNSAFGPVHSKQSSVSVEGLVSGQWSIVAKAYNQNGNELAVGKASCCLESGSNRVDVILDTLTGEGSIQLTFKWKASISSCRDIRFAIVLEDSQGVRRQEFLDAKTSDCSLSFSKKLAAGSYTLTVRVSDDAGLSRGCAEAIRVVANETSIGVVNIEDCPASLEISIGGSIGIPIPVYATCTPTGTGFLLSARCDTLPAGLAESDLKYRWFRDGEAVGFSRDLKVSSSGSSSRYDVIVSCSIAGTSGSATVAVN